MVTRVTVGGKEYPVRMTMGALMRFKRETGHDVSRMEAGDVAESMTLLWCCVKSACEADGVAMELTALELADRMGPAEMEAALAAISPEEGEKKTEIQ